MSDRLESSLESLHQDVIWPVDHSDLHWSAEGLARPPRRRATFRRAAIAFASVSVIALVLIVSPQARQAVAGLLEAAGIKISVTEEPLVPGALLDLGSPVSLEVAKASVDFSIRSPAGASPGEPDGIYLDQGDHVNMVWRGGDRLPAAGSIDVTLLFSQWSAGKVSSSGVKTVTPDATTVKSLLVEGSAGLWIEGASHNLTLLDGEGNTLIESTRLAANVLLWDFEGVNYRIETTSGLKETLRMVAALEEID